MGMISVLLAALGLLTAMSGARIEKVEGIRLVAPGRVLTIYTPRNASVQERAAAEDMARVLERMGAPRVDVRPEPWFAGASGVYVGDTLMARCHLPDVVKPGRVYGAHHEEPLARPFAGMPVYKRDLPSDRWDQIGLSVHNGVMVLAGSDPQGSQLAVYWFLQHHGKVRWWVPGPIGEDIPRLDLWSLPRTDMREQPEIVDREFDGVDTPEEQTWAIRNLLSAAPRLPHSPWRHMEDELERMARPHPTTGLDAPQAWLAAQLLWNPVADPEELEHEFFTRYYGNAGYRMRLFFKQLDDSLSRLEGPGTTRPLGIAEAKALRTLLLQARAEAVDARSRARVELALQAFDAAYSE